MLLKNNSSITWENYDLGHTKITIKPNSTFEVDDATGQMLLRLLGSSAWLVRAESEEAPIEEVEEEAPIEEVEEEAPIEEVEEEAPKKKGKK